MNGDPINRHTVAVFLFIIILITGSVRSKKAKQGVLGRYFRGRLSCDGFRHFRILRKICALEYDGGALVTDMKDRQQRYST